MKEYLLELFNAEDLELAIGALSIRVVAISAILLILLILIATFVKGKYPSLKKPLFISISLITILSSSVLIGSTVWVNTISESGGPVHWHADIEYWACGNELELKDPSGLLSNKIGTAVLHEHDDRRIHLEGVVVEKRDASLGKFQKVIGGQLTDDTLVVPLNDADASGIYSGGEGNTFENDNTNDDGELIDGDGESDANAELLVPFIEETEDSRVAKFVNGQECGDEEAEVQVFAYQFDEETKTYWQEKLENPAQYIIAPESIVPPGDCIIFEFSPTKEKTDKLCHQYGVRDIERCTDFGVEPDETDICEITEVENPNDSPEEDTEEIDRTDSNQEDSQSESEEASNGESEGTE